MMAAVSMVGANKTNAKLENVIPKARLMAHSLQVSGPRCRSTTHVEPISVLDLWSSPAIVRSATDRDWDDFGAQ